MKMYADERREHIYSYIKSHKRATVRQLSDYLSVTEATVRSDLRRLESENKLTRTHGGAKVTENISSKLNFSYRLTQKHTEKYKISKHALKKIKPQQCIMIDASSTTYELAKLLADTTMELTIITNGLENAVLLKENPHLTVLVVGGFVSEDSNAITGNIDSQILEMYHIDYFFLSANGLTLQNGLTDFSLPEVQLKKQMVQESENVIALIDSSKFDVSSTLSFAKATEINEVITDQLPDHKWTQDMPFTLTIADN
ncbi:MULTISPECIES: DeoR/GlpR family DNA-binding transcription regulator [Staphylococcus]|uniref:DeoR/GlpR transcriptional regulator n=1 Tax=Staphylococcus gallinarum TaxID=1293 RepID=A0A2T4T0V8_STAGA|nr:DeoR/GlpR family DNA-binding transcription regulator [Staphylococcus gallinarum]MBU7217139.1 DeoR/GlpR family DNA-binding transcription regulator [Staphylococcus gallinarum]MCD8785081.1 DeoR/GlpR family DNA-binding transcription regulator [Staphylococcus gallinarum]MCD8792644.1 DeoR/GlpR family DNA-binding transcription regulator [Staphylococcus gallinarum]MCD8821435.1 DeoR/GlpR family DNA-binding transcription regulator [Staphylococcus gallinarum]MCD8826954.1 DeoR/GlpR family DNA-binding t